MGLVRSGRQRGNGTSGVVGAGSAFTLGNALILTVIVSGSNHATTITPSGGGTWTSEADTTNGTGLRMRTFIVENVTGTGGSDGEVTVNFGASVGFILLLAEFTPISQVLSQAGIIVVTSGDQAALPVFPQAEMISERGAEFLWGACAVGHIAPDANPSTLNDPAIAGGPLALARAWNHQRLTEALEYTIAGAAGWVEVDAPGSYLASFSVTGTTSGSLDSVRSITHGIGLSLVGPAAELSAKFTGRGEGFAMLTAPHSSVVPPPPDDLDLPDRWLFRGQDITNLAYLVSRVVGVNSHPALRGEDAPFAGQEGRRFLRKLPDSRLLSFAIYVYPVDEATGALAYPTEDEQARANLDALHAIVAVREPGQLMHVLPDGSARVAAAEAINVQDIQDVATGIVYGLMVDFHLADPWFYGLTISGGPTTISASGQTITIDHPGNVPGSRLILELLGPFTGLAITNRRNGARLEYAPAITSAQRLHLNCRKREARVNGALVLGSVATYSPPGDTSWIRLEPGENVLEVTGSVVGGALTHVFLPPYV